MGAGVRVWGVRADDLTRIHDEVPERVLTWEAPRSLLTAGNTHARLTGNAQFTKHQLLRQLSVHGHAAGRAGDRGRGGGQVAAAGTHGDGDERRESLSLAAT